ncbi:MAG TPA: CpaF family protein, partial [Methylocystis sp.]
MFGKRTEIGDQGAARAQKAQPATAAAKSLSPFPAQRPAAAPIPAAPTETRKSDEYYITKSVIFGALIEAIDLAQLSKLDPDNAREEIRDIVNEIISIKNVVMSISEQEELL